jgi:hypothetical protein
MAANNDSNIPNEPFISISRPQIPAERPCMAVLETHPKMHDETPLSSSCNNSLSQEHIMCPDHRETNMITEQTHPRPSMGDRTCPAAI